MDELTVSSGSDSPSECDSSSSPMLTSSALPLPLSAGAFEEVVCCSTLFSAGADMIACVVATCEMVG